MKNNIEKMYLWPISDWVLKNGEPMLKRKYGKYGRQPIVFVLEDTEQSKNNKDDQGRHQRNSA
jgi:hypothetical protein